MSSVLGTPEQEMKRFKWRRKNARTRNIEFKLTFEEYLELKKIDVCYYTGEKLICAVGGPYPNSWSLDRIDPSKGYEVGNLVVCSHRINLVKGIIENRENRNHVFTEDSANIKVKLAELSSGTTGNSYSVIMHSSKNSKLQYYEMKIDYPTKPGEIILGKDAQEYVVFTKPEQVMEHEYVSLAIKVGEGLPMTLDWKSELFQMLNGLVWIANLTLIIYILTKAAHGT